MKNILIVVLFVFTTNLSQGQTNDYAELWRKVQQFEMDGLPKSALEVVEEIKAKAQETNNTNQLIKTLFFKSKFALILEEDAQLKIIRDLKKEISGSQLPYKNIYENVLANLYWQYFQQHRYQFYNRTTTKQKVDAEDFRTWDLQTLFSEVHLHYQNSLQNGLLLQQENLSLYDELLTLHADSKLFRPTLFDFLSYNALQFYKTRENNITKPAYKFEIDDQNYMGDAKVFSRLRLSSKDSSSLQLHALKIFQNLLNFHLNDKDPHALVHADIERLKFVYGNATFSDKAEIYIKALKDQKELLKSYEASTFYSYETAFMYKQLAQSFRPEVDETHKWKNKEALEVLNAAIDQFPDSRGAQKCRMLSVEIKQPRLIIKTEHYLPVQQNARLLVEYRNIDQLSFKVLSLTHAQLIELNRLYQKRDQFNFLEKLKGVKQWQSKLRNEGDYQIHRTEVLLPELEHGNYILYAKENADDNNYFSFTSVQITNMSIVQKNDNHIHTFQVIDRNSGKPISNAHLKITYKKNHQNENHTLNKTTNAFGEITLDTYKTSYRLLNIEVDYNGDISYFNDYYIRNTNRSIALNETTYVPFVFTDRSIYRPGQTVYFKGIVVKRVKNKSEVVTNKTVQVKLHDVNGQTVSELDFETNEFGSFNGEFIIPNTGLTGLFKISVHAPELFSNNHYFSVEEYKRPKFETLFDPITETYKINDSVTINGKAMAFAGSSISNAKVVYRVYRKAQYPGWYYWHRPWFNSEPQEITHGESYTNDQGEFSVTFKALPDLSLNKKGLPIFNYIVTADVTDLNGETRSATAQVNVGYQALKADITIDNKLNKTKKDHTLSIRTQNLNGQFVAAKGRIKIYKLKSPDQVLRQRKWAAPDYQEFRKETFTALFPHIAYNNENNSNTWERETLVFDKKFDTQESTIIKLGKITNWKSGQYIIELESKDKFGQDVKDIVKTMLYSPKDKTLVDHQLFNVTTNKISYKIGEQVELTFASAAKNLVITVDVEKDHKIVDSYLVELSDNKKTLSIPVDEKDLGGFVVYYSFSAFNSFHSAAMTITVPYPKTDLEIETLTFRDKLQPGQEEIWNFKIKGPKGDRVSAEILASMYDSSLDKFKGHHWAFNPIQKPIYRSYNNRYASRGYDIKNFRNYINYGQLEHYNQAYDQLNWFGFHFNNAGWIRRRYLRSINMAKSTITSSYIKDQKAGTVRGQIKSLEDGEPLPYVNVLVKGTSTGTQTDFDGNFTIKAKKGDVLVFSYIGMSTLEQTIDTDNYFSVTLAEDNTQLEEVVIMESASEMIIADDLEEESTLGFAVTTKNALQGQVAGLGLKKDKNSNGRVVDSISKAQSTNFDGVQIRKNLQETAFFFPELRTDAEGNVSFSFTTPEALTKWKLQLLAHTKALESATTSLETVTQKELMVIPNAPRFLREGDQITISSKIANISDKELSGQVILQLFDALTGEEIDGKLGNSNHTKSFSVDAKGNTQVSWDLDIPSDVQAVQYKIIAKAGDFSDGEQNALPVLTNRKLVTETLPMWIRSNETRTFTLDKLKTNTSTTLKHHQLTLEMTSNPAWYAVQALPYLMEYPHECNEQIFSRYYANALASHIANSNPRIQEVFNQWASQDALISNMEKNQDLKSLLIQETPWLRDAQSETEQKKRIALLFDLNKMKNELQSANRKLQNNQMENGAWAWFNGGQANRYITQHIISGYGHLNTLNVSLGDIEMSQMIEKAIQYLDEQFVQEYKDIRKYNKNVDLSKDHLSYTQLHYLYMRSFFPEIISTQEVKDIATYYHTQIKTYWLKRSLYSKGLMALVVDRMKDHKTSAKILKSLKENSITNEELGMYWKENTNSWYWYQAPIETQALLIEAFSEIENDTETIDNLKIWLLKNKQTNRWKTTKATTEAVYALLLQGSDWLSVTDMVDVVLGNEAITPSKLENVQVEAGTGYFKTSWSASEIKPEMADVQITKKGKGIAWGGLYWQYFEDLDKITSAETPLNLRKKLFLKTNTDKGEEISEITAETSLKVGDLVRVRIELRVDRTMEFVHMKDMRAAGLEPVNVLSGYKWQDGLGYYESTKDASTNFFFDVLPKGVYVFEYDLRVNNAGNMSNGITTIQSMYAPEFSSHSEGVRIKVN